MSSSKLSILDKYAHLQVTEAAINEAEDEKFILNGCIAKNRITTIYADPNQGKTTLAIAVSLLADTIYLDAENPIDTFPAIMLKTCNILSASCGASVEELLHVLDDLISANSTNILLVVDTLSHFVDPNNNNEVMAFYQKLHQFRSNGNSIIILHHTNKGSGHDDKSQFFGSSVIKAQTDTMLYLSGFEDSDANIIVTLEPEKKRGYIEKKSYKVSTLDYTIEEIMEEDPAQRVADQTIINCIEEYLKTGTKTTSDLHQHLYRKKVSTRKSKEVLSRYDGNLWIKGGNGRKREWSLPQDEQGAIS